MTAGIRTEDEPIERALFLDGREAMMLQTGNLDGVDVQMAVVALADKCLFDFVYITRPENFTKGFGDFHQMLHSFESRTGWNNALESSAVRTRIMLRGFEFMERLLSWSALKEFFVGRQDWGLIVEQLKGGVDSWSITILTAVFTGMVMAMQFAIGLEPFGASIYQ